MRRLVPETFEPFLNALPLTIVAVVLLALVPPSSTASVSATPGAPDMIADEVLIKFTPGASPAEVRAVLEDLGATRIRRFRRIQAEQHRITRYDPRDAVRRYRSHRAIEVIEPNWIVSADVLPNDPVFGQQWGLHNTGQTGGTPGADIDAAAAWDLETGSPEVVVAIIDTGIDITHPDLAGNVWTNPGEIPANGVDDDGNGWVDDAHGYDFLNFDPDPMDDNGHGTHVAGTVAAVGNNALGGSGVAWGVKILPLKFLGAGGSGPVSSAVLCVEYATQMGAHVLNNSWGGAGFSSLLQLAIQSANAAGIPFVAAAGNSSLSLDQILHYPASYNVPNVIPVASTTPSDQLSTFSNYGPTTVPLAAPGSGIWSTLPGGQYGALSGTSMAAPHVSGALALLRSRFPSMPGALLKEVLLRSADRVPLLEGFIAGAGRLNTRKMLEGLDSIPPAPIQDLAVDHVESNRIVLRWIATGDDGVTGQASRYEVRFARSPFGESEFDSAEVAPFVPLPRPAGAAEIVPVQGLAFETTYFFAVKALDEYGNAAPMSNVVSAKTLGPPDIDLAPTSLARSLLTGQSSEQILTVANTASGTLDFAILTGAPSPAGTAQPTLALAKGEADPRSGDPVLDGRGGPDRFGHQWIDNDEPGGPAFQWIDVGSPGNRIELSGDDELSEFLPIGFTFPFYDNLFSFVRLSTNGFLTFTSGSPEFTNQPLPSTGAPENLIAPFWDDLYFESGSTASAYTDGLRFIAQWTNVMHYGGGGPYTFQVILHRDGTIVMQYLFLGAPVTSATTGIQNGARDDGLSIVFNGAYLHSGLAVRITSSPRWVSVSPAGGSLAAGQALPVAVRFDARGLPGGVYDAALRVTSNDPDEASVEVPVRLAVTAAPDISVAGTTLAFLRVFVGSAESQPLLVTNEGVLPLEVSGVDATPSVFEVDGTPFLLEPGETRELEVRFHPMVAGAAEGQLTIRSDDPDEAVTVVALQGDAIPPPDIALAPASLDAALFTGETTTREITIRNEGSSSLSWHAFARGGLNRALTRVTLEPPSPTGDPPDGPMAFRDTAHARAGALEVELADLTGVRIVFDQAHGSAGPGLWAGIIGNLTERGATFAANGGPITPALLAACDVLWLTDSRVPWTSSEIEAARDWLHAGGSILMEGDNDASIECYNAILAAAGAGFSFQEAPGTSGLSTLVHPHATTRGIARVLLEGNAASLSMPAAPGGRLLDDVAGVPAGAYSIVGSGTIAAFSDELFSDFHSLYGDNQLFANQVFDWLGGISWLHVGPSTGTTPPGGTSSLTASLDAAELPGGEYAAEIVIANNDPDEPGPAIPVLLRVTGAPDIRVSKSAVDFGPLFLGASRQDTLRVTNQGTARLSVGAVEIEDPAIRSDLAGFDLEPGASRPLILTFEPARVGPVRTTAVLRSNDPDEGALSVSLSGDGLEPPDIELDPGSFAEALETGQAVTRTLRVSNASGSDLDFVIELRPVEDGAGASGDAGDADPSGRAGGDSGEPLPASGKPWPEYRPPVGTLPPSPTPQLAPLALPIVIRDPPGDGGAVDLVLLRAGIRSGELHVEMQLDTSAEPANLGGFLSLDTDQNRSTGRPPSFGNPFQDVGAEYEVELFSLAYGLVSLHDVVLGIQVAVYPAQIQGSTIRFAIPLAAMGGDDGRMDATGVIGTLFGPTDWYPDRGHGTIGGVDWLTADPDRGRVGAGGMIEVSLRFDAGSLDGGRYDAAIVVRSNDPDEPSLALPASLDVTGVPLIAFDPPVLDFGSRFVGSSFERLLTVFNVGSAPLRVLELSADDPAYSVDGAPFELPPHAARRIAVRFRPASPGERRGSLLLVHNAAGSPSAIALTGTGVPPPVVTADPTSIEYTLASGGLETRLFSIGNAGGSDLEFAVGALTAASDVPIHESMDLPRGAEDPRRRDPVAAGSGGPDRFGYRWIDSLQPGGPVFQWVDITSVGTRIPMTGLDDNYGPVPIGFEFPFYGNRFTHLRLCTHGWISFTNAEVHYTNQPLPSLGAPENLIAAYWEDLNFAGVERVTVHNDGTRFIIQYTSVPRTGGGGPYTFQVLLYPTGTILYQYLAMGLPTDGATVGIQNGDRTDGLSIAFNASYVRDGLAIRIAPSPTWLALRPLGGTILPGEERPIRLSTNAQRLFGGDYPARIEITSNDPVTPALSIPILLHVIGVPDLAFSPSALAYDTLYVGGTATRSLRVTNLGTARLELGSAAAGLSDFAVAPSTLSLAPLQSAELTVTFTPTGPGDRSTMLELRSDDPDSPAQVPISATALLPPRIALEPDAVVAVVPPGGRSEKTIRIRNTGGSDLRWRASSPVPEGAPPAGAVGGVVLLDKGALDTRAGIQGNGGPDRWGHRWLERDHPDGPEFEWTDIRELGTPVPFGPGADDENLGPFPIGFDFLFYGGSFDAFRVCTNGWISFTSAASSFLNQPLPSQAADVPENLIAATWDDLVLAPTGAVHYASDGDRLVVQWSDLAAYGSPSTPTYTFQVILHNSGEIVLQYKDVGPTAGSATVGIQNAARDDGLAVAFNAPFLYDGQAARIFEEPRWLGISPGGGVVPAGGFAEATLALDAGVLEPGDYRASVPFESNDPDVPVASAPVLLRVGSIEAVATDLDPNTVNLASNGRWITARVELPDGYDPSLVVPSSVRLAGTVPLVASGLVVGDFNGNGRADLELRFDREAVEAVLPEGDGVEVRIEGEVENTIWFVALDRIRVIRPRVTEPRGGESLRGGSRFTVRWENPEGWSVEGAVVLYSLDGGGSWRLMAEGVQGHSVDWTVPEVATATALVRVYVQDASGVMGYDTSDGAFTIQPTISSVESDAGSLPRVFALRQNAPNPFDPETSIRWDLPRTARTTVRVFAADGRLVRAWTWERVPAGRHRLVWDGRDGSGREVAAGIYFCRLTAEGEERFEATRRMVRVR